MVPFLTIGASGVPVSFRKGEVLSIMTVFCGVCKCEEAVAEAEDPATEMVDSSWLGPQFGSVEVLWSGESGDAACPNVGYREDELEGK